MKTKYKKILFLDILTGDPNIRKTTEEKVYEGKTYAEIVRQSFGIRKDTFTTIDASLGKFKNISPFSALVIGGSAEDPVKGKEKPWMKQTYVFLRSAVRKNIPILGICGGLQFVIRALGGEILYNPKGLEIGNKKITLTKEGEQDPLFEGLPREFPVQENHRCMVKKLKNGWKLLALSDLCRNQAIAIGDTIRLVQFHPERKTKHIKVIIRSNRKTLLENRIVKNESELKQLAQRAKETDKFSKMILRNFINNFVKL